MATKFTTRKNSTKAQTLALRQARTVKRGGSVNTLTRSGHVKAVAR
jgi:hypothetical protein